MTGQTSAPPPGRPARSLRRMMAAVVLGFEALVVFFAALVAKNLSSVGLSTALWVGGGLAVACLVAAGMLRSRGGWVAGWVLQVLVLATGFWVPMMFFLGAVFAALWLAALRFGERIDREKAAYVAASRPA
jgi:hypothetical protein